MNNNNRKPFFKRKVTATMTCKCGQTLKQKSKTNYPFGKKSKARKTTYYLCPKCGFHSN